MAITNFRPTIWHAALLENFHQSTFVIPTLNRDYEGDITNGGESVKITGFTSPTIKPYAGAIVTDALTDSTQSLLINQKDYYAFQVVMYSWLGKVWAKLISRACVTEKNWPKMASFW